MPRKGRTNNIFFKVQKSYLCSNSSPLSSVSSREIPTPPCFEYLFLIFIGTGLSNGALIPIPMVSPIFSFGRIALNSGITFFLYGCFTYLNYLIRFTHSSNKSASGSKRFGGKSSPRTPGVSMSSLMNPIPSLVRVFSNILLK